jgi:nitroreductase
MKYNLTEITDLIRSRRSIMPEQYSDRKVHREQIELILNNAIWAPTHGLTQPWRFKVFMEGGLVKLGEVLADLYKTKTSAEQFKQGKLDRIIERSRKVSVIIAICMERDKTGKINEMEEIEAVACAVQNMMLTCTAYGLGSYWSSPKYAYSDEMKTFLNLGAADKCLGLFYIGYPSIQEWPVSHRKPLEYVSEWINE